MDLGLKKLEAVATRGIRGIGRAIAETLAVEGADIAICARNGAEVKSAIGALRANGLNASGTALHLADRAALKAWGVSKELGGIDFLVANVSALVIGGDDDSWR
jgi:3-oxoacyl-[acyl-carrier protein] reductase